MQHVQRDRKAEAILKSLLDANKMLLDCPQGEMVAILTEHILPKNTDENTLKTWTERRLKNFRQLQQENPQPEETQFDLERAISFNTRFELANESTTTSRITYRWQDGKYYYGIEVLDRKDSLEPPAELKEAGTAETFMTEWNRHRVFTFDHEKAVNYFKSANAVHIQRDRLSLQHPRVWGILSVLDCSDHPRELDEYSWSTRPVKINNKRHQELLGEAADGQWIRVIFDPGYETRPLHVEYQGKHSAAEAHYWNYEQVDGQWYPEIMFLELYELEVNPATGQSSRKLSQEITWEIEQVDTANTFGPGAFEAKLQPGDLLTDFRFDPPLHYVQADTKIEQVAIAELADIKAQYLQELASVNCPSEQVSAPLPKAKTDTRAIPTGQLSK